MRGKLVSSLNYRLIPGSVPPILVHEDVLLFFNCCTPIPESEMNPIFHSFNIAVEILEIFQQVNLFAW